jgi:hypothetical protein
MQGESVAETVEKMQKMIDKALTRIDNAMISESPKHIREK